MSNIYTSVSQLIGHTPLLELSHIEAAEGLKAWMAIRKILMLQRCRGR